MEPSTERAKILRQKDLPVPGKFRRTRAPFTCEEALMQVGGECDPIRAVDTMRPAYATRHTSQLLSAAGSIASNFAKRIAAHRKLGMETRLHQLPRGVRQQWIGRAAKHARHERRTFRFRQATRRSGVALRQRTRYSTLANDSRQSRRE